MLRQSGKAGPFASHRGGNDVLDRRFAPALDHTVMTCQPAEIGDAPAAMAMLGCQPLGQFPVAKNTLPQLLALFGWGNAELPAQWGFSAGLKGSVFSAHHQHWARIVRKTGQHSSVARAEFVTEHGKQLPEQHPRSESGKNSSQFGGLRHQPVRINEQGPSLKQRRNLAGHWSGLRRRRRFAEPALVACLHKGLLPAFSLLPGRKEEGGLAGSFPGR